MPSAVTSPVLDTPPSEHGPGAALVQSSIAAQVVLAALGLYIVLKPYYLLPSGLPQVADLILMGGVVFVLFLPRPQRSADARKFIACIVLFCSYAAVVSLGWTFALMDPRVVLYAAYYAFNLGLMIVCLRVGAVHPDATLRMIAYAISASAIIQAGTAALTFNAAEFRQIASFNNPNQLGYWSLLSLGIFWLAASRTKVPWYIRAATLAALSYTVAISLSKAAMIAVALLVLLHFLRKPKMIWMALVVATAAYLALEDSTIIERVTGRLQDIGEQQDDGLYERGYLRIVRYPEYAVLGAGEGALYRFNDAAFSDPRFEIHSTFGTILFSYGAIGVVTFAGAVFYLYRISKVANFLYLAPPLLYGLTHQGLRFSFLWLLLAVIAILAQTEPREAERPVRGRGARPLARRLGRAA